MPSSRPTGSDNAPAQFLDRSGIERERNGTTDDDPVEHKSRLCLATSADGIYFEKYENNPILNLAPEGEWDSIGLETPFVLVDDDDIKLYYYGYDIIVTDETTDVEIQNATLGAIGLATSPDGYWFERYSDEPVLRSAPGLSGVWDSYVVEGPWVIKVNGAYRMYFGGAGTIDGVNEINAIGVATSDNGIDGWDKYKDNPVFAGQSGAWDQYHTIDPCVIVENGIYYMWYHGGNILVGPSLFHNFHIGVLASKGGYEWERLSGAPVLQNRAGTWTEYGIMAPSVLTVDGEHIMYFHGLDDYPDNTIWSIGRATLN